MRERIKKIVDGFSRRLQLQERMTVQVAELLERVLDPAGVAVLIEGEHMCVECDVKNMWASGFRFQTSHMLGIFRDNKELRREFFTRLKLGL